MSLPGCSREKARSTYRIYDAEPHIDLVDLIKRNHFPGRPLAAKLPESFCLDLPAIPSCDSDSSEFCQN
jgi:hypothetical protein